MSDVVLFLFLKQKTAYEMRISDWSSDVCSSDLDGQNLQAIDAHHRGAVGAQYLQRREAGPLARQIAGDPVADADAGDDQRGEPDQRQKLPHPFDEAPRSGRAVAAVAHVPSRVGKLDRTSVV